MAAPPAGTLDPQSPPPPAPDGGRRRRRSRWDSGDDLATAGGGDSDSGGRRRKTRWAEEEPERTVIQLPDFMKDFIAGGVALDPEVQSLNARLMEIARLLQSGLPLDDRPEPGRSPSPEPVYDGAGVRINTREHRAREKLGRERQGIISELIKRNPAFKPPPDYRPPKLQKKLYIPMKEYPGYNFIGLIIGPRGNTQKRMEKETGAKIVVRGKGSMKEGRSQQKYNNMKVDPGENEDLHVLVEAETQESLDAAVEKLENLLQVDDEKLNEHKRMQLRELAALNGTIRDEEFCRLCGEPGHRQFACTSRSSTFKSDVQCRICGDGGHPAVDCPMKEAVKNTEDDEYRKFLAELGGAAPEPSSSSSRLGLPGGNSLPPSNGGTKFGKEYDESNLYIGYLPPAFNDASLVQLFSPFGEIVSAKVVIDRATGLSKGYGFVKYSDVAQANAAIAGMNGYRVEGRVMAVRVAGKPPPPPPPAAAAAAPPAVGPGPAANGGYVGPLPPWCPPVPPPYPSYGSLAPPPPPPGSNVYAQPWGPYGAAYPPPTLPAPPGSSCSPAQVVAPSDADSYPPGVQCESSAPSYSVSNNVYGVNPGVPSAYPPSTYGYPSYYPAPPAAPSSMEPTQTMDHTPWLPPPPPAAPPPPMPSETPSYGADTEYDKFMAELK